MQIETPRLVCEFRPWRPDLGQVFSTPYAFDCETTLIDENHPWIAPSYVLGAASDGRQGYFIPRHHLKAFWQQHLAVPVAFHYATFDLRVIQLAVPDVDIYTLVDSNLAWDTQLLHRLYMLGREGHTASGEKQSTLEHCTERYLGFVLRKDVQDSRGQDVRTSYGQWLTRQPHEIEPVYLEYLGKDVLATLLLFHRLRELLQELLGSSQGAFGFVSPQWLSDQVRRWGWQTHHIQLRAAIVLQAITANGLGIDLQRREELVAQLDGVLAELQLRLRGFGFLPGQPGSGKALQEILRDLERRQCGSVFPRTPTGKYESSREALAELADSQPFVRDLLDYKATEKLRTSFIEKMGRQRLHPSFNTLMVSGRTSSFGEINAQNLPRDDRVRSCFVPSPGHVFLDADYATLELATLAQAVQSQFGQHSRMGDAINAGRDLHRVLAATVTRKAEADVSSEERRMAKPVNFGLPGGMGLAGLRRYARASYGVDLSEQDAESLTDAWFGLFPEMETFLGGDTDNGQRVAEVFGLTPLGYCEHTGLRHFVTHPNNAGREREPNPILGAMCLKTLKVAEPTTRDGGRYHPEEIDYFWSRVTACVDRFPVALQTAIRTRKPSPQLQRAALSLVDRDPVYTWTGRLRANASYCARHNTVFQGLAADGAKLALWLLWRAGYRIVNFVHDEVLIEIPVDSDWTEHAARVSELMRRGMQEVVPDINVEVELAATERWYKSATRVLDEQGRLQLWLPSTPTVAAG